MIKIKLDNTNVEYNYYKLVNFLNQVEKNFGKEVLLKTIEGFYNKLDVKNMVKYSFQDFILLTKTKLEENNLKLDKEVIVSFLKRLKNSEYQRTFILNFFNNIKSKNAIDDVRNLVNKDLKNEMGIYFDEAKGADIDLDNLSEEEFKNILKNIELFSKESRKKIIKKMLDESKVEFRTYYNLYQLFEGLNKQELKEYFDRFYEKMNSALKKDSFFLPYGWSIRYLLKEGDVPIDLKKYVFSKNLDLEEKYNKKLFIFSDLNFHQKISKNDFYFFLRKYIQKLPNVNNREYNNILSKTVKAISFPKNSLFFSEIQKVAKDITSILKNKIDIKEVEKDLLETYLNEANDLSEYQIKFLLNYLSGKDIDLSNSAIEQIAKLDLEYIEKTLFNRQIFPFKDSFSFEKFIDSLIFNNKNDEKLINKILTLIKVGESKLKDKKLNFSIHSKKALWVSVLEKPIKSIEDDINKWISQREFDNVWCEDIMYYYLTKPFINEPVLRKFAKEIKERFANKFENGIKVYNEIPDTFQRVLVNKTFNNEKLYKSLIKDYKDLIYYDIRYSMFYAHPFINEEHFAYKDLLEESKKQSKEYYKKLLKENEEYKKFKKMVEKISDSNLDGEKLLKSQKKQVNLSLNKNF